MEQSKDHLKQSLVYLDNEIFEPYIHTQRSMDEYIHEPYWRVVLSDDRLVYSAPHRRSWLELKSFLQQNPSIYIQELLFGFRDHQELIHRGAADYFFVHSYMADSAGPRMFFYIGGFREDDIIICKKFRIPEVYLVEEERRSLDDISIRRGLIKNEQSNLSK